MASACRSRSSTCAFCKSEKLFFQNFESWTYEKASHVKNPRKRAFGVNMPTAVPNAGDSQKFLFGNGRLLCLCIRLLHYRIPHCYLTLLQTTWICWICTRVFTDNNATMIWFSYFITLAWNNIRKLWIGETNMKHWTLCIWWGSGGNKSRTTWTTFTTTFSGYKIHHLEALTPQIHLNCFQKLILINLHSYG